MSISPAARRSAAGASTCRLIYGKAYASYALKCVVAPDVPNNAASLAFFTVSSPVNILNAERPAPVSLRHVIGHLVPDLVLGALAQALPGRILAEGAASLWNIHMSVRPVAGGSGRRAEVLMFNSGGMGARPGLDGLSATAFPSGVHTMPVEATEQTGPIVIWRKELRPDSGGDGEYRGGLGQVIEIAAGGRPRVRLLRHVRPHRFSRPRPRRRRPGRAGLGASRRWDAACAAKAGSMCRRAAGSCWSCPAAAVSAIPSAAATRRARRSAQGLCDGEGDVMRRRLLPLARKRQAIARACQTECPLPPVLSLSKDASVCTCECARRGDGLGRRFLASTVACTRASFDKLRMRPVVGGASFSQLSPRKLRAQWRQQSRIVSSHEPALRTHPHHRRRG